MNKLRKFGFLVLAVICALFVFTSCRKDKGPTAEEAAARISTTVDKTVVTKDFVVNNSIVLEGVTFTVTWESNNAVAKVGTEKVGSNGEAKENGGFYLVSIGYETNTADQNVTLTATVANGKDTAQKSISFTVPKFATATFAEYAAADKETSLTVDGIVTGIMSKTKGDQDNALFLNALDNTGGFYIYKLEKDPVTEGIKEGMTVRASGQKDLYSGTYEIVNPSVRIIDETIKNVTPVDLTEAYKAAADLKAETLVGPQALLVTIKGVKITSVDESNGYYKFKLGELESYIRVSSSNCPLNADETKAFKDGFAAHTGWLANATGIVSVYSGNFYLQPVTADAFEYLSLPELTTAEQVEAEKESLKLDLTKFGENYSIKLPLKGAAYEDVVIAWTSSDAAVAIDATGKATITLGAAAKTVKLTATLTKGTETATKEFSLELAKASGIEVADPVDGQEFYAGLYQANLGQYLFFTGVPKEGQTFYQTTTKLLSESVKIKVTAVEGGYKLSFVEAGTTKYITMSVNDGKSSVDIVTDAAKAGVYAYDTTYKTFIQTIGEEKYFLGANKTYETISASKEKYLSSNFPLQLLTVSDSYEEPSQPEQGGNTGSQELTLVTSVEVNKAYKIALVNTTDSKTYFFKGVMNGYYGDTSTNPAEGVDMKLEATTGGYYLYFENSSNAKQYINIEISGTHVNFTFGATASTVWTWNTELKALTGVNGENTYFMGTYGTYKTFGMSSMDKVSTSYVAQFYIYNPSTGGNGGTTTPETPEQGGNTDSTTYTTVEQALAFTAETATKVIGYVSAISEGWNTQYSNMTVMISDNNGNEIKAYRLATEVKLGQKVIITGSVTVSTQYGNQIGQGATAEVVTITDANEAVSIDKAYTTLPVGVETSLNLPATGVNGSTITWVVKSGTGITINNGAATVTQTSAEQTVVLTATFAKSGATSATQDYTVKVLPQTAATGEAKSISFSSKDNRTEFTTSKQVWVANGITVTNNKGASTSNVGDYASPARFYKGSDLIISFTSNIVKIVVDCNSDAYATAFAASEVTGATMSVSGDKVTIILATPAISLTLKLTSGQVRIDSIEIHPAA